MKSLIGGGSLASRTADPEEALIARLSALAPALDGEPDAEWQSRTRALLIAMAAVRTPEPDQASPVRRLLARREGRPALRRTRLSAGLAGAAAAVVVVAGAVTLSADARPGDALYGVKRSTEQTQLALAGDARGSTLLGFAHTRLEELSAVLPDDPSADLVDETLATMDAQTTDGAAWLTERALESGSTAPLDELSSWSAGQSTGLADVRSAVPSAAEGDVADSAGLLADIDQRTGALRVALDCPAGPVTEGSDALGPVPGTCTSPPPSGGQDAGPPPVTDRPDSTAGAAPGSPADETAAPGADTGSGGSDGRSAPGSGADPASAPGSPSGPGPDSGSGSSSGAESGQDPVDTGLPGVDPAAPDTPDLPAPDLPSSAPDPEVDVDVELPGTPAAGSTGSSPGSPDTTPDLDVCPPPLPVIGDC